MEFWQIWGIVGILLFITEMLTPVLFFLNLAIAAALTAVIQYFVPTASWIQVCIFAVASTILLIFLRPLLLKIKNAPEKTGVQATYYGQCAKVAEKITANSGRINIYGEAWDARTENGTEIEQDAQVKILYCKDLTMYVEKINQ